MLQVNPYTVVTRSRRVTDVGRDVMAQHTGADWFTISDASEGFAFSHARTIWDASAGQHQQRLRGADADIERIIL